MVNDCVRLGQVSADVSYPALKSLCYSRMMEYQTESSYRFSAIFEASNLLKLYRNTKDRNTRPPHCRRPFASASVGVTIEGEELVMPGNLRMRLNRHTISVLERDGIEIVSATMTPQSLGIVYRKNVPPVEPEGAVALDINLENVTTYDTEGRSEVYGLSKLVQLHERHRRILSRFRRRDLRVRRDLFAKYGATEHDKRAWILHNVSSTIVYRASAMKQAVVMENLEGLKKMFRRESGSSASYLSRMNSWPFAELQRQVAYKARWEGLPVTYIEPEGTSNSCSECGGGMVESPAEHPIVACRVCGLVIDRDLNAAKNILSRALRSRAVESAVEAMIGRVSPSREAASKVDADNSSNRMKGSEYC